MNISSPSHTEMDNAIRDACKLGNALHYHTHDSRRSEPGFPDWTILPTRMNPDRSIIFAEVKTKDDRLSVDQHEWITELRKSNFAVVVRPETIHDFILIILNGFEYSTMRNTYVLRESTEKELQRKPKARRKKPRPLS